MSVRLASDSFSIHENLRGAVRALRLVAVAIATLCIGGTASAQYGPYAPVMDSGACSSEGELQDAVDEAADILYEELYAELSSAPTALEVACSIVLEPGDKVGSSCGCSASGPNAACTRNVDPVSGVLRNVVCADGQNTTVCRYTGPRGNPKRTCGCTTR